MVKVFKSQFKFSLILIVVAIAMVLNIPVFATWLNIIEYAPNDGFQNGVMRNSFFIILYPVLVFGCMILGILHYTLMSPKIRISSDSLTIGPTQLKFNDISEVIVTDKVKVKHFLIPYYKEVSIIRSSSQEWTIPWDYYANGHLIRVNLAQLKEFLEGKSSTFELIYKTYINTKGTISEIQSFTIYRRSIFHFPYTYYMGLLIGFLLYHGSKHGFDISMAVFATILLVIFYCISGTRANYFILYEQYLKVKNLLFPWQYRLFKISDIIDLEVEELARGEVGLKITTRDYKTHIFICELLNEKMLEALIQKVKEAP